MNWVSEARGEVSMRTAERERERERESGEERVPSPHGVVVPPPPRRQLLLPPLSCPLLSLFPLLLRCCSTILFYSILFYSILFYSLQRLLSHLSTFHSI